MTRITKIALGLVTCTLLGCGAQAPSAPDPTLPGTGTLPPEAFVLRDGRVLAQSGENTAVIETARISISRRDTEEVRAAASAWCGRPARVSPLNTSRTRLTIRRTFIVSCQ